MSINAIIRTWKADDEDDDQEDKDGKAPKNPAGQELSDEELEQAAGGLMCRTTAADNPGCGNETYR